MRKLITALEEFADKSLSPDELLNMVNDHVSKCEVADYLKEIEPTNCYLHQLGFYKFVIASVKGAFPRRVRLHYWKRANVRGDIHDHIGSFASKVLFGSLINEVFSYNRFGSPYLNTTFIAAGHGCHPDHQTASRRYLLRSEKRVVPAMHSYHMSFDKLHRLLPVSMELVTLVLQDVPKARAINVFRPEDSAQTISEAPRVLTAAEICEITNRIEYLCKD